MVDDIMSICCLAPVEIQLLYCSVYSVTKITENKTAVIKNKVGAGPVFISYVHHRYEIDPWVIVS